MRSGGGEEEGGGAEAACSVLVTTGLGWAGRCGGEMIDHRASRDRESGKARCQREGSQ